MTGLSAVIVGGGIGGVAAAVALARNRIDVRVYEQAPRLAEVGAGVVLAPNSLRARRRLVTVTITSLRPPRQWINAGDRPSGVI